MVDLYERRQTWKTTGIMLGGKSNSNESNACALVIDLDGTLTPVDTLHEAALRLALRSPMRFPAVIAAWKQGGKAALKSKVSELTSFHPEGLPLTAEVLALIDDAKAKGRTVVLCTASDAATGAAIVAQDDRFAQVMSSDGVTNLSGQAKAEALVARFGHGKFDYAGNAKADLPVWKAASNAIVVSRDATLIQAARAQGNVSKVITPDAPTLGTWANQMRLHQWSKNALLFVPLIASQSYLNFGLITQLLLAFIAFGLIASATYAFNDIVDIEADRAHPQKRDRPLAAGIISVRSGVLFAVCGLAIGLALASVLGTAFLASAIAYIAATLAYSLSIKRMMMLDCLWLAGLFTLRIVAGAAAIGQALSHWLLLFSIFLFLSLAYLKRFIELRASHGPKRRKLAGRGYTRADQPLVFALGVGAGYASSIVLSLYLFSPQALELYNNPYLLVLAVPIKLYWMSHMWLRAHKGEVHHDPVIFAMTDRTSLAAIALFFVVFLAGASASI